MYNLKKTKYLNFDMHGLLRKNLFAFPKNLFSHLIKGRFDLLKAHCRAMLWNLKNVKSKAIHRNPMLS